MKITRLLLFSLFFTLTTFGYGYNRFASLARSAFFPAVATSNSYTRSFSPLIQAQMAHKIKQFSYSLKKLFLLPPLNTYGEKEADPNFYFFCVYDGTERTLHEQSLNFNTKFQEKNQTISTVSKEYLKANNNVQSENQTIQMLTKELLNPESPKTFEQIKQEFATLKTIQNEYPDFSQIILYKSGAELFQGIQDLSYDKMPNEFAHEWKTHVQEKSYWQQAWLLKNLYHKF